jgi:hypothetical protein
MERKKLSDSDLSLLKKIFEFSGYTTCLSINNYKTDRDICNNRRFLYKLLDEGYIKENHFYSDSRRYAVIYQVTTKTCKLFGNPGSYFRKKHSEPYIIRALIKQHFFFEICKTFESNIISLHEDRVHLLTNTFGFDANVLPKKIDNSTVTTHVEEYILDMRNTQQGNLTCLNTGKMLFDFENSPCGIIFVYVDRNDVDFYKQLMNLYSRYKAMLDRKLIKIDFLIVVDNEERESSYKKTIDRYFKAVPTKAQGIHDNLIKLHIKILQESLNVSTDKTKDLAKKIKSKYSLPQKLTIEDFEGIPVDDIRLNGLKAVEKAALEIVNSCVGFDDKMKNVTDFFRKIYKLYSAGKLKKDTDLDIKVYRIGHKFSL